MNQETLHRLYGLLSDRAEIKSEIELEKQRLASIETEIAMIVAPLDKAVKVPGIGSVVMTKPSVSTAFDANRLRELIQSLRETGCDDMADEIAACTKRIERAGSLRITVEK